LVKILANLATIIGLVAYYKIPLLKNILSMALVMQICRQNNNNRTSKYLQLKIIIISIESSFLCGHNTNFAAALYD
jgi:hypothetical protein